jgi:hypothetical protein
MHHRSAWVKITGLLLALTLILITAPFTLAESIAAAPLGAIVTSGSTTIGSMTAPSGTTLFDGDLVVSSEQTLVSLNNGSRVEMTKTTAHFDHEGEILVLHVDEGLLWFKFNEGDQVRIHAGDYLFTTVGEESHTGELGLNSRGQIAMNVLKGAFEVLDTASGQRSEVSVSTPFAVMDQTGKGVVSGKTIKDNFLSLEPDSLKGQCVVAGSEAYPISGNSRDVITVDGTWKLRAGEYTYQVVEFTEAVMIRAGASQEAARAAEVQSVFGVAPAAPASHTMRNVAIVAGIGGGVAIPIAIKAMGDDEKSPSSR